MSDSLPEVVTEPGVMLGKPVIAGTRVTVELILEKLAAGELPEQILRAHPHLPNGSVEAAVAFSVLTSDSIRSRKPPAAGTPSA